MRRRRFIASLAAATALAPALSACGREEQGASGGAALVVDDGPATGSIDVWAMGSEGEALPDLLAGFKAANPEVSVQVTAVPWDEAPRKIQTAIAGGTTPDLTMVGADQMPSYVAAGGLQPVPDGLVPPGNFYGGAWQGSLIQDVAYAVPWYVETRVLFYRKDIAAAAGWPEPPTTWDELQTFAKALQGAGATYGLTLPVGQANSWSATLPYFWQAGGSVTTPDGKAFDLGSDAMVEALTFIDGMFRAGVANPDQPTAFGEIEPLFIDGTYGAFTSGPWEVGLLRAAGGQQFLDEKVGATTLPAGPSGQGTGYIGGGSWSVFKDAANPDAAWKLVRWLSQPEQQQEWYAASSDLPAVQAAWEDEELTSDPFATVIGEQLTATQGAPLIPTWVQVGAELDTITEQLARGVISPAEAAAQMQSKAAAIGVGDQPS